MQAYGTLTIVDLLDTATYIYYADNAEGSNPSATSEGKTHIGIYSGPALSSRPGVPDPNWSSDVWSGWQKYVGEDGAPGAPGTSITIKSTSVQYITTTEDVQPGDSANWQSSIPTTPQGSYLWTRTVVVYSDNSTTKTYSKTYLGKDANAYNIQTNQEEVFAFITSSGRETSPGALQIKLYKLPITTNSSPIDFSQNYSFGYIDKTGVYHSLITQEFSDYFLFGNLGGSTNNIFTYDLLALSQLKNADNSWKIPTDVVFKFAYLENGEEVAIKPIPFRLGTTEDMAQFNLTATNINAAVRDSYMQFDEKGISLYVSGAETNAGLKIYRKDSDGTTTKVFWADEAGNLNLKGHVEAESGSFTGTIHATDASFDKGEIGGFTIEADSLISKDGGIVLNGSEGTIRADSIELGIGATIKSYISLGNATLYNPNAEGSDGKVLESGNIKIMQDGTAFFGGISVNGSESKLFGENWYITPDKAEFSNISIKGSIETAVFNASSVQSVGGAMMFMQSYKVESISGNIVTIDKDLKGGLDEGTLVWLVEGNNYSTYSVVSTDGANVTLNIPSDTNVNAIAMIVIGKESNNPLVFGVNSGNTKVADDYVRERGLTISTYGNNKSLPNLFLGDLSVLNSSLRTDYTGYGLYSDNVYLNGSLTTKLAENTQENLKASYAGINTLSEVEAKVFSDDTSRVVFWAGASSTSASSIQGAPFQVTEEGSIYATRANLTNSLLVGGEIRGADIYTARIHGTGDQNAPALSLYDTNNGISFRTGYNTEDEAEVFSIHTGGLRASQNNFISINGEEVVFIGDKIKTKGVANYLSLTTISNIPVLYHEHSANQSCGFYFDNGKTVYKMMSSDQENIKTIWSSSDMKLLGAISFAQNENDTNFQYRPTEGGYDLYVAY